MYILYGFIIIKIYSVSIFMMRGEVLFLRNIPSYFFGLITQYVYL